MINYMRVFYNQQIRIARQKITLICLVKKTLTLEEFIVQDAEDNAPDFDPIPHLKNLKPCSVEPERLFSNCRLSQNFLQYRLLPENLARNVFLSKNKPVVTIE